MENKNLLRNRIIAIVSIIVVAGLGALFVQLGMDWFDALAKPSEWVPDIVIPIVWTVIYVAFAVVLWLWFKLEKLPKEVLVLLIINGVLNVLWCLIFFTLNQLLLGNILIILNVIFGIKLLMEIAKSKKAFAYALYIYPIWLCIATTLNLAVWILN